MKYLTIACLILLLVACQGEKDNDMEQVESENLLQGKDINSKIGLSNNKTLDLALVTLNTISKRLNHREDFTGNSVDGSKKVKLYSELVDLFEPNNFDCGCDDKVKSALRKLKPNNQVNGFVPSDVANENGALIADSVLSIGLQGSNILAHSFQYKKASGELSIPLFARTAVTTKDFDAAKFLELNPLTYPHFIYTMDCNGYLSAAVNSTAGVNKNSIKASASGASSSSKSLFILVGVMYTHLYQAYKGEGIFAGKDTASILKRINVLEAIGHEIADPNLDNKIDILLNSNYHLITASNTGTKSFNGKGDLNVTAGVSFGIGSAQGTATASGSVDRKSEFVSYKTYIVNKNIGADVVPIPYVKLKELISTLKAKVGSNLQ